MQRGDYSDTYPMNLILVRCKSMWAEPTHVTVNNNNNNKNARASFVPNVISIFFKFEKYIQEFTKYPSYH